MKAIVEAYRAYGKPIPPQFIAPPLPAGYEPWMEAFWELCTERHVSEMFTGSIPWSAIRLYGSNMSDEEFEAFHSVIRTLDSAYLKKTRPSGETSEAFTRDHFRNLKG